MWMDCSRPTPIHTANIDDPPYETKGSGMPATGMMPSVMPMFSNAWKAKELLNSTYDSETPNNAINTLKERNLQLMSSAYYTDTDAFTLTASPAIPTGGLIAYLRRKPTFARDGDFNTGDALFKVTFRFSIEIAKANNLFHSAGA